LQPVGGNKRHKEMDKNLLADAKQDSFIYGLANSRRAPRFVRRVARFVQVITPRRFVMSKTIQVMSLGLVAVVGSGYLIKTSKANSVVSSASSYMGFQANKLVVNGNVNLDINVLQARLATQLGNSLFSFKVDEAREEILNDSWVEEATVRKIYPDTIVVDVVEREPVALWQSKGEIHLISDDGFVISKAGPKHMNLPQVVGDGANMVAAEFLSAISRFPVITRKAGAYVRVAGRRWNVRINDGPQVLLPEADWQVALFELQGLQAKKKLLDRDIVQIDMRLRDRLVIKLDPKAADIRKTAIQKSLKRDWHKT